MNLKIYSVYDKAVGAYMQPFFQRSEGEALRSLRAVVNDKNSSFSTNPGDFTLCYHGEFADDTGVFISENPSHLVNLSSLVDRPETADLSEEAMAAFLRPHAANHGVKL